MKLKRIKHLPGTSLALVLSALLIYLLGWSTLLSLKSVRIEGSTQTQIINSKIYGGGSPAIKNGLPLARIDVKSAARRISDLSFVASETINRDWLHGSLVVRIVERIPVASFKDAHRGQMYLDKNGVEFSSGASFTGVPDVTLASGSSSDRVALATLIQGLPSEILASVTDFSLKDPTRIVMNARRSSSQPYRIIFGDTSEISLKVAVLNKLMAIKENSKARIFDVSHPLSPISRD